VARHIDRSRPLNFLALGNSLVQAGFDEQSFQSTYARYGRQIVAINGGLGSSTPVEHLMLLRHGYATHARIDCLFYGFFDFQLTSLFKSSPDDLIGNRAMLYYLDPEQVPQYFGWSTAQRAAFRFSAMFPAIQERGVIWEKVEKIRRVMASTGMPPSLTNRFGNVKDFEQLEAKDTVAFVEQCKRETAAKQSLSKPIQDLLKLAGDNGTRVVMVEMPMSPTHRERYYARPEWRAYTEHLSGMLRARGAALVEADDWLPNEAEFLDHVHANPHGASLFSSRLAQTDLNSNQLLSRVTRTAQ
jgi:hypothetical protein